MLSFAVIILLLALSYESVDGLLCRAPVAKHGRCQAARYSRYLPKRSAGTTDRLLLTGAVVAYVGVWQLASNIVG